MIRRALQDLGFKDVRDKASAPEALSAIKSDRVHLVISDYNMPEMDGLQFLEAVRADPVIGKTVFIMLTGSSDREVVQKAAALGVNNYVVKPFAPAALKEKIERVFGELT
ncbi:two-component system chemotaxis response regulator CheY [Sphingomonas trueperi]|uniref:Two-component system chemotaxis response regulator CheY n=2 Tax=Sphingomonadaceae TaxID=41297 RepID=A0A7X6BCK3_9SPHN|nr:two-component system chemotaxis response regulator CheY [Sphingomonas trueperi]